MKKYTFLGRHMNRSKLYPDDGTFVFVYTRVILKIMKVVEYLVNHDTGRIETLQVYGTALFTQSKQK